MIQVIKATEELISPEFKLLADAMPQIVWLADASGVTYYYNAKWYEFMGNEEGHDKEPYFYSDVLHPDDSEAAKILWKDCVKNKSEFKTEYRFVDKKNGGYRWILARALPVKDSTENVTWYGTYTDIDEQKKNQEKLVEALQFRDDFLSIAGHELKTPITSLNLQIQMALKYIQSGKRLEADYHEKVLLTCLKQSRRLSSLVEGLLDITHIRKGDFGLVLEEENVSEIIRSIAQELSQQLHTSGIFISLDVPDVLNARIDARRIEQVLLNLFMNSLKYAPGARIKIRAFAESENVQIVYEDEGPGIDTRMKGRIFERYERATDDRHISGLGLGLFIVKKIIESHNGEISLLDDSSIGTSFLIQLPKR